VERCGTKQISAVLNEKAYDYPDGPVVQYAA
jgi:hypothetical protein